MAITISNVSRGCRYYVSSGSNKQSTVQLEGLNDFTFPIIFSEPQQVDKELVGPMPCLENVRILYTFGSNFGEVSIMGEMLLGTAPIDTGAKAIREWYGKNRISVRKTPLSCTTVSGNDFMLFVTGFQIGQANAELNTLLFSISGLTLQTE